MKLAKANPLPFAFCPASGKDAPTFSIHRRKKPEVMAKSAKKDSGQNKVAFGSFTVEGKTMKMTCDRVVPGLVKQLKKHLRSQKVAMDVILLDASGEEIG